MILIRVTYHTRPGMRDAFVRQLLSDGVMAATRKEKGNADYTFSIPVDDPDALQLIEIWEDQAAVDLHCAGSMFRHIREIKEPYVTHSDITMFDARQKT